MHPATEALLAYFEFKHLPPGLQAVSKPFHTLAHFLVHDARNMVGESLNGPEVTVSLRKLLEAKDCAVRAAL